jgi:hypothetical protein
MTITVIQSNSILPQFAVQFVLLETGLFMAIPLLFGPYGISALDSVSKFAQVGVNAFWFHGFNPAAFEACQKYDISPCVEFKTFRANFDAHPQLIPIDSDGQAMRYGRLVQGVCLSKKDFLEEIETSLLDGLQKFHPAGIWLDYLTYAGWFETPDPDLQDTCFCPDCITEFCEATGVDAVTPAQILKTAGDLWQKHKCERVARYASRYAHLIRSTLPGCVVGAYMCPWLPEEFEGALKRIFAQDYALLAQSIDVFTPLIYCTKSGRDHHWGRRFLEAAPGFIPANRQVQLILDALEFPGSLLAAAQSVRPSWGIQIFDGGRFFNDPDQAAIFAQAVEQILQRIPADST